MRIVIAERNQIGRGLLAKLLRMEGHDVFLLEEGGDARQLMRQHRPDVVLMNMFATPVGTDDGLSPMVMVTSMGTCEKLSAFTGAGECDEPDSFDRLSASAKIGAMDYVQQMCEMLSRKLSYSSRNEMKRPLVRSTEQGLLNLYAR